MGQYQSSRYNNMLYEDFRLLIADHAKRRDVPQGDCSGNADSPWDINLRFVLSEETYTVRSVAAGDETALQKFGASMGDNARDMFCPYPWNDSNACMSAFSRAVTNSVNKVDASYLLFCGAAPIGHFFLWKANNNSVSTSAGLSIPELGIAIVDSFAGHGLGALAVRMLLAVATQLGADAVELTTATTNEAGRRAYSRAGFTDTGLIQIPLDVDVTAVESGEVVGSRFRSERQMVYIINKAKRPAVLSFLSSKRAQTTAGA
ncbi:MAG TPA: GNAT family N-acetyltransferase [Capsulimonadaceae bacterium]|jgi:RimJ/RimL family protein N-acetyltransferase